MGGMLDCSAAVDDEVDVTSHTGPIHKPFHRMTLREIEYTVNCEKEQFKKSMEDKNFRACEVRLQALMWAMWGQRNNVMHGTIDENSTVLLIVN